MEISSLQFINGNLGLSGGETFLRTIDGGISWIEFPIPADDLGDIFFADENIGYAVGNANYIFKTTNGGGTITGINTQPSADATNNLLLQNYPNPFY